MKSFSKDIVVIDFEVTGFDIDLDEPLQIGLVVLDKDTLEEKASYVSWIKPTQEVHSELPGIKWATISEQDIEEINKAPSLVEIVEEIIKLLPERYFICAWNATFDFYFWKKLLKEAGKNINTANIIDLWTLAYIKLLQDENYKGDYKSESVFQYFGAQPRTKHDGLEDCRIEAQLFKKLLQK
jgi:DNA polymerase III epsilon subunit-like protein